MPAEKPLVLVVDDEKSALRAIERILAPYVRVLTATNAGDALRILGSHDVDSMVTDLRMPGANGLDLLLQAAQLKPGVGRIMVSGHAQNSDIIRSINEGHVTSFVLKPYTPDELRIAVLRTLHTLTPKVLIVDDQRTWRLQIRNALTAIGVECGEAAGVRQALERARKESWDVALVDLDLGEQNGVTLLHFLRTRFPEIRVIIFTATDSPELAAYLRRLGAYAYITKNTPMETALFQITSALQDRTHAVSHDSLASAGGSKAKLVGNSPATQNLRALIDNVAVTDVIVLIRGETGVGKELVARRLHDSSLRRDGPFFAVNCAALGSLLFESEMFGHERGAFTGALAAKPGLCEVADEGTLFLDEIGELSREAQSKLLRFMQAGEFMHVGGTRILKSKARVIAATNRDLEAMVEAGTFRPDLYHRLTVFEVSVAPLRDRREEIPEMAEHFIHVFNEKHQRHVERLGHQAMRELLDYGWPGNVRELGNVLERAVLMATGPVIEARFFGKARQDPAPPPPPATAPSKANNGQLREVVRAAVEETERDYLHQLLAECHGRVAEVARRAGVERRNLYRKLGSLGLDPAAFRAGSTSG